MSSNKVHRAAPPSNTFVVQCFFAQFQPGGNPQPHLSPPHDGEFLDKIEKKKTEDGGKDDLSHLHHHHHQRPAALNISSLQKLGTASTPREQQTQQSSVPLEESPPLLLSPPLPFLAVAPKPPMLLRLPDGSTCLHFILKYLQCDSSNPFHPSKSSCYYHTKEEDEEEFFLQQQINAQLLASLDYEALEQRFTIRVAHGDGSPNRSVPPLFPFPTRKLKNAVLAKFQSQMEGNIIVNPSLSESALLLSPESSAINVSPSSVGVPGGATGGTSPSGKNIVIGLAQQEGMRFPYMVHITDHWMMQRQEQRWAACNMPAMMTEASGVVSGQEMEASHSMGKAMMEQPEGTTGEGGGDNTSAVVGTPSVPELQKHEEEEEEKKHEYTQMRIHRRVVAESEQQRLAEVEKKRAANIAKKEALWKASKDVEKKRCLEREGERFGKRLDEKKLELETEFRRKQRLEKLEDEKRMQRKDREDRRTAAEMELKQKLEEGKQEFILEYQQKMKQKNSKNINSDDLDNRGGEDSKEQEEKKFSDMKKSSHMQLEELLSKLDQSTKKDAEAASQEQKEQRERLQEAQLEQKYQKIMVQTVERRRELKTELKKTIAEKEIQKIQFVAVQKDEAGHQAEMEKIEQRRRLEKFYEKQASMEERSQQIAKEQLFLQKALDRQAAELQKPVFVPKRDEEKFSLEDLQNAAEELDLPL